MHRLIGGCALPFQPLVPLIPVPDLIQRYANGEALQDLASEAKVSRVTLYKWMLSDLGAQGHHDMVTECLIHRIADADHNLAVAADMVSVTRAQHQGRFSRLDLERRRPALYGPKHSQTNETSITVTVNRDRKALPIDVQASEHDTEGARNT